MKNEQNTSLMTLDATINVIGSIKDLSTVENTLVDILVNGNDNYKSSAIEFRSEKSNQRYFNGIKKAFLSASNSNMNSFTSSILKCELPTKDMNMFLFWLFCACNNLFREISINVYARSYMSGRELVDRELISGFVRNLISSHHYKAVEWKSSTVETIAVKYLNLMRKLGFIEPSKKNKLLPVQKSSESIILFLYMTYINEPETRNIFSHKMFPLILSEKESFHDKCKSLSMKGFLNMEFRGDALVLEFTNNYKDIFDALYHRT